MTAPVPAVDDGGDGGPIDHRKALRPTVPLWRRLVVAFLERYGVVLLLIPMVIVFTVGNPNFLTVTNVLNIGRQVAVFGIIGIGMTILLLLAHVDLSVGSVVAFSGVVLAEVAQNSSIWIAIAAAITAGALVGVINGVLTVQFALPSLLVTLATLTIFRGLSFVVTDGSSVTIDNEAFREFGNGSVLGVPNFLWVMLIAYAVAAFLLGNTKFGRHIFATGGNAEAARRSGIRTSGLTIMAFIITGALAGFAGVMLASRLASAQPIAGSGYELAVIAAVVLGGTSLFGGHGSMLGTLIGVVILGTLQNGMDLLAITPYVQTTIIGVTIAVALLLDSARRRYMVRIRRVILQGAPA